MRALELLAPAKNLGIGTAAIDCGADAVYIAGPKFGAREKAGNSFDDIASLCSYAHRFGVKVYLTLNTILKEDELKEAERTIAQAYESKCDGVIVQDLGVLKMEIPPIPLIASTQCDIRTPAKGQLLERLGFKRLILARELSLMQISEIAKATDCELEFFVHGALCVSYSGQCYLSEYLAGRSANRGECVQACRNNYDVITESGDIIVRNKPILSLKDLSLSGYIAQLVKSGITSFKIEGRLKNESYVKNIVTLYRKAIDDFIDESGGEYVRSSFGYSTPSFSPNPLLTFNRGYTKYFIEGKRKSLNSGVAKHIGEPVGRVETLMPSRRNLLADITYKREEGKSPLKNGDGVCFVLKNGEIVGGRVNTASEKSAQLQFSSISDSTISRIKGQRIYRTLNFAFEKELARSVKRKIPIGLEVEFIDDASASSQIMAIRPTSSETLLSKILSEEFSHPVVFKEESYRSENKELCIESVRRQLGKEYGNFIFSLEEMRGVPDFYRAATLNGIRRKLATVIDEAIYRRASQQIGQRKEDRETEDLKELGAKALEPYNDDTLLANCANSFSKEVYKSIGFELKKYIPYETTSNILMRTKYCIRNELGLCLKNKNLGSRERENLYLRNNWRMLRLEFDCVACEMLVKGLPR